METKSVKVVIAADNALIVNGLRHNLENKFNHELEITGCYDVRVLLRKVHEHTDIVVLDSFFDGISAEDIVKKITAIDHDTAVIMHSSHHEVIAQIKEFMATHQETTAKRFSHKLAS